MKMSELLEKLRTVQLLAHITTCLQATQISNFSSLEN